MTNQPNELNKTNYQEQSSQSKALESTASKKKPQVDPSKTITMLQCERADGRKNQLKVDPEKTIPYLQTGADHERKKNTD